MDDTTVAVAPRLPEERPPPSFWYMVRWQFKQSKKTYEKKAYKRYVSTILLLAQYILAALTIAFPDENEVIIAYGSVSVLNGLLVACQLFFFQAQTVVVNESLFDIFFLVRLLFLTSDTEGNDEAQAMLVFALVCACLAVLFFALSYWLAYPEVVSLWKMKFKARTRYPEIESVFQVFGFIFTDTADFTILATRVVLLNVPVDTKVVLFVLFLLINPIISQLGTYVATYIEESQDLALPPKDFNESKADFQKRQDQLDAKLKEITKKENTQERKNTALTGVLAIVVFPILYAVVVALNNASEALVAAAAAPLFTALPLWFSWQIMGIPWDKYILFNDAVRTMIPRIMIVTWSTAFVVFGSANSFVVSLTLLLYSLLPLVVLVLEYSSRRTRLECLYREMKVYDEAGTRRLYRSKVQDKLKRLYELLDMKQSRAKVIGSVVDKIGALNLGETAHQAAYLDALTSILQKCHTRGNDRHFNVVKELDVVKASVLERVDEVKFDEQKAIQRSLYLWSEARRRLVGDKDDVALWELVKNEPSTSVTSIELYEMKSLDVTAESLQIVLQENKFLRAMNFRGCNLDKAVFEGITWRNSKQLMSLNFRENELGDEFGKQIAEQLPWHMESLIMEKCKVGDETVRAIGRFMFKAGCALTNLNLDDNEIGPAGAESLAEGLKVNTALEILRLWFNNIGDNGAVALGQALEVNATLVKLNLRLNNIGDAGAVALGNALGVNKALQNLSLDGNKIGNDGALALGNALGVNKALQNLSLNFNKIGDDGSVALGQALEVNATLVELDLEYNEIGSAGAESLAGALKVNTTLETLNLYRNNIGGTGRAALETYGNRVSM